jgi:hypothetical protein
MANLTNLKKAHEARDYLVWGLEFELEVEWGHGSKIIESTDASRRI